MKQMQTWVSSTPWQTWTLTTVKLLTRGFYWTATDSAFQVIIYPDKTLLQVKSTRRSLLNLTSVLVFAELGSYGMYSIQLLNVLYRTWYLKPTQFWCLTVHALVLHMVLDKLYLSHAQLDMFCTFSTGKLRQPQSKMQQSNSVGFWRLEWS